MSPNSPAFVEALPNTEEKKKQSNVINRINRMKREKMYHFSWCKKVFDKVQYPLMLSKFLFYLQHSSHTLSLFSRFFS